MSSSSWSPSSWQSKPIQQDVTYTNPDHLQNVLVKLEHLPPLVTYTEVLKLRKQLHDVALGKAFLLQGGDCAELFDYTSQEPIEAKLKVLLQMSLVLTWGARTPVVRIARMAGQYAKPRSKPTEITNDGREILSFRGENVNGFDISDRIPDPDRLLQAYFHSAATLNYVRAILGSGFADLHRPMEWSLHHVVSQHTREEYSGIVKRLLDALDFMKTVGADTPKSSLETVDLFTSHEGLILEFEQAMTRSIITELIHDKVTNSNSTTSKYYNSSAHFIWIGDRTRQIDGAHVEYFRGIENPIGIKVGPSMDPDELSRLLDIVNPKKEVGKVTLISRYGTDKISKYLPAHIDAVRKSGHIVVWSCDPMHGNTRNAPLSGVKTRDFNDIIDEVSKSFIIHKQMGSMLNGVHFELTGDSVTECIGGSMELKDSDLSTNYQTFCDPRLNYEQSLDVAFLISKFHQNEREGLLQNGISTSSGQTLPLYNLYNLYNL